MRLYFATNRDYQTRRSTVTGFGTTFQNNDPDLVRFGTVDVALDQARVDAFLAEQWNGAKGNGEDLADYVTEQVAKSQQIELFGERLDTSKRVLGSQRLFKELKSEMDAGCDIVVYVHGYNVDWNRAVGSAMTLELGLNNAAQTPVKRPIKVVLFTWPSDGKAILYLPYKSDRRDARASGRALGRVTLFMNDFVNNLKKEALAKMGSMASADLADAYRNSLKVAGGDRDKALKDMGLCGKNIHLLCHSMGAFVLESAIAHIDEFTPGERLPALLEQTFLLASDVDSNALESSKPLSRLVELSRESTVFFNRQDLALRISHGTKNNENRLGLTGPSNLRLVPNGITSIDCTGVIDETMAEHGYHMGGAVLAEVRRRVYGDTPGSGLKRSPDFHNYFVLEG